MSSSGTESSSDHSDISEEQNNISSNQLESHPGTIKTNLIISATQEPTQNNLLTTKSPDLNIGTDSEPIPRTGNDSPENQTPLSIQETQNSTQPTLTLPSNQFILDPTRLTHYLDENGNPQEITTDEHLILAQQQVTEQQKYIKYIEQQNAIQQQVPEQQIAIQQQVSEQQRAIQIQQEFLANQTAQRPQSLELQQLTHFVNENGEYQEIQTEEQFLLAQKQLAEHQATLQQQASQQVQLTHYVDENGAYQDITTEEHLILAQKQYIDHQNALLATTPLTHYLDQQGQYQKIETDEHLAVAQQQLAQIQSQQQETPIVETEVEQAEVPLVVSFNGPPEISQVNSLITTHRNKFYHCGFVYKLNALGANGTTLFNKTPQEIIASDSFWSKWWMELWGPVLHLWRVPEELASFPYTADLSTDQFIKNELDPPLELMAAIKSYQPEPLYINIAEAKVELFDQDFQKVSFPGIPPPPIPYSCHFAFTSACSNLYLLSAASMIQVNHWVAAIRLSIFELAKLNTLFTYRLMKQPTKIRTWDDFDVKPFTSHLYRGDVRYEGPLQIRQPYSNVWQEYHVVVTSKVGEEAYASSGISKKFFRKKKEKVVDASKRGTMLFYESKAAMKKSKEPLFIFEDVKTISAIWPDTSELVERDQVTMAKLQGSFALPPSKVDPQSIPPAKRSFINFAKGLPNVTNLFDLTRLIEGSDSRPAPLELLIIAPSTMEAIRWITVTLISFGIDFLGPQCEEEIKEMTKIPPRPEVDAPTQLVHVTWPTQLYLSLGEIGGVAMPNCSQQETTSLYSHYLAQKVSFSTQDKLRHWCQSIATGEWERGVCDRNEILFKISQLREWTETVLEVLSDNNVQTGKPHPSVLVEAMANVTPWLGPILASMVGAAGMVKPVPIPETVITSPDKEEAPEPPVAESSSSDGEGSVSEEERSDEGSLSEDESETSEKEAPGIGYQQQLSLGIGKEVEKKEEKEDFQVYGKHSLIAQIQEKEQAKLARKYHSQLPPPSAADKRLSSVSQVEDGLAYRNSLLVSGDAPRNSLLVGSSTPIDQKRLSEISQPPLLFEEPQGPLVTGISNKRETLLLENSLLGQQSQLENGGIRSSILGPNRASLVPGNRQSYIGIAPKPELILDNSLLGRQSLIQPPKQPIAGPLVGIVTNNKPELQNKRDGSYYEGSVSGRAGPLLGEVDPNKNKPTLKGGLLGQLDKRRKEMENFKKTGVFHSDDDRGTNQMLAQLYPMLEQLIYLLKNPSEQSNPMVIQMMHTMASNISLLMAQAGIDDEDDRPIRNPMLSTPTGPNSPMAHLLQAHNPYAIPNLQWKKPGSSAASTDIFVRNKKEASSASESQSESYATSSSSESSSGSESDEQSADESSGTDSVTSGSKATKSTLSDSEDEDIPLTQLAKKVKAKPIKTNYAASESGTSATSSASRSTKSGKVKSSVGSVSDTTSNSGGSVSEKTESTHSDGSESDDTDIPLGELVDASHSHQYTPGTYQQQLMNQRNPYLVQQMNQQQKLQIRQSAQATRQNSAMAQQMLLHQQQQQQQMLRNFQIQSTPPATQKRPLSYAQQMQMQQDQRQTSFQPVQMQPITYSNTPIMQQPVAPLIGYQSPVHVIQSPNVMATNHTTRQPINYFTATSTKPQKTTQIDSSEQGSVSESDEGSVSDDSQ
ncbi:hypothetical protein HDV02_000094 [Globomyces sp. JEL0801]|nr:hypothetical protein HDV02_000094 [Globomyces sp. JEL0801]